MNHKLLITIFLLVAMATQAQEKSTDSLPVPEPKSFVTSHQIRSGGRVVNYSATASETYLKDAAGKAVASIWSVAYVEKGVSDASKRPVTFIFNGGPGSASVWLHMGMFGPERIKVPSDADADDGAAPYNLVPNDHSLLDLTDLVFVDPVGTGYSRVVGEGKVKDYWGLTEDARSIATFIRQWVTENNRWFSPKYIAGESFGTTRAAGVANALEGGGQNMALNGLILISQALDYAGSTSVHDNITSYLTYLPSMSATAWYHKKAGQGKTLESFVAEAREFTYNSYAPILYKGVLLSDPERNEAAEKLSYFTGLDKDYILKSDLRVLVPRFQKKLLEDQGLAVGRLDGRFMGDEADQFSDGPHLGDPASYQISSAYTAGLNHYFASRLNVDMDRPYITSNGEIYPKWNWRPVPEGSYWEPSAVNVTRQLSETMRRNPEMKVLVASGYYDLICPFFDAEYTFSRNGIPYENITMTYYEAGHMMYTHEPDFTKLASDIREFLTR
ncbi:S10 family peptidase [Robiginitalea sp. SC105]|uniref:S10 family peptidase n=1 Tax=Robiginitalea sp. SC105 TaxID=2762332 RepID=UPI00163AE44D|nr:peptidase S10 [Robiginitalea sp. SC105]MBC2838583.1 peptidase S10 [Robiginitalea sp. SC105]